MRHHIFEESDKYHVALLIKPASFGKQELINNYILDLERQGVPQSKIIAFTLDYSSKKPSAKEQKAYLDNLLPALKSLGVTYLYCCDGNYFKTLIRDTKADVHLGYSIPCGIKGFEDMQVVLGINHHALLYNPEMEHKLALGNKTLASVYMDTYIPIGEGIIHKALYPSSDEEIKQVLNLLKEYPVLTCDIETFSLKFQHAGIGTIGFGVSKHEGLAFAVDYFPLPEESEEGNYGIIKPNHKVRSYLKEFFETYTGKLIWHGATFDLRVLIYQLFMNDPLDRAGMLYGLHTLTKCFDDTKTISYLAVNSTAGNDLGLKDQAHEFAGNWAKGDIENILSIPLNELLQYNVVDVLSTWYVYEKNWPIVVRDNQDTFYREIALPSLKVIIQCELVGMPMYFNKVLEVNDILISQQKELLKVFDDNPYIDQVNLHIQTEAMNAANAKLKTKQHPLSKYADKVFNPNSDKHVQYLLYTLFGLPVIDLTKGKQPAVGGDTIAKLINHTKDPEQIKILQTLIQFTQVDKIISSFMPAFLNAFHKEDGMAYLHGCFNFGGTVSGRLSSSDPNLQQLPANSVFGKLIKSIFQAAFGWLMVGADFSSLEDRINALLTKDPNKLRVYTDGYDGHSLRAYAYFKEQMADIVDTQMSINSISKKYPHLRQESKSPTFALTYQGTWRTMVNNLGWDEAKAKEVEARYHELYKVSDDWVSNRIQQACKDGYAEAAFGLRIRTPLLKQTILGASGALREAQAESRTLGNAISGQSYGLLTNRAINAFMDKVWKSEYALQILPIAMIHDAIYLLIENNIEIVEWVNRELIHAMQWQELPEIEHDQVKLGAELDIFYPSWSDKFTLPNEANKETILKMAKEHKDNYVQSTKKA